MSFGYVYLSCARHAKQDTHTFMCVCVLCVLEQQNRNGTQILKHREMCRGRDRTAGMQGNHMFSLIACWLHFWRYELRQWRIHFTCFVLDRKLVFYLLRSFGHFGLWISNNPVEGECFRLCWFRSLARSWIHQFIICCRRFPGVLILFSITDQFRIRFMASVNIDVSVYPIVWVCVLLLLAARCVRWATQTKQRWISLHHCWNVIHSKFAKQFLPRCTQSPQTHGWVCVCSNRQIARETRTQHDFAQFTLAECCRWLNQSTNEHVSRWILYHRRGSP